MLNHWDEGVWDTPSDPHKAGYEGGLGSLFGTHPRVGGYGEKPGLAKQTLHSPHGMEFPWNSVTGPYMSCKLPDAAEISSGGLLWLALAPSQAPHTQSKDPKGIFVSPSNACPAHRFLHRQSGLQLRARGGASTGQDRGMVTSGQVSAWLPSQWDRTWPPGWCLGTDGGGTGMGITGKGGGSSRS